MALRPSDGIGIVEMRTIEAEGIVAPLLSDHGTEVIRLEFPKEEKEENSQDYRAYDRGKMRVRFRPGESGDRKWLEKLPTRVDVVVTSVPDTRMSQWDLDVNALYSRSPGVICTSVTDYGQTGPCENGCLYDEATIWTELGFMPITGPEHGNPVRSGSDFVTFVAGANAYIGTPMALIDAQRTGRGKRVDVSMMDSILYGLENQFNAYLKSKHIPE